MTFVPKPLHPSIHKIVFLCLSRGIAFDFWGTPEASSVQTSLVLRRFHRSDGEGVHVFVQDTRVDDSNCRVPKVLASDGGGGDVEGETIRAWLFDTERDEYGVRRIVYRRRVRFLFNDPETLFEKVFPSEDDALDVIDLTDVTDV